MTAKAPSTATQDASAYLAELAWSESPSVELLDAYVTRSDGDGVHARAAEIVMQAGGLSCTEPPPSDIAATARTLERQAFGRSAAIGVAKDFGAMIDVRE